MTSIAQPSSEVVGELDRRRRLGARPGVERAPADHLEERLEQRDGLGRPGDDDPQRDRRRRRRGGRAPARRRAIWPASAWAAASARTVCTPWVPIVMWIAPGGEAVAQPAGRERDLAQRGVVGDHRDHDLAARRRPRRSSARRARRPARARRCCSGVRLCTSRSWPPVRTRPAMARPIRPRPTKPTLRCSWLAFICGIVPVARAVGIPPRRSALNGAYRYTVRLSRWDVRAGKACCHTEHSVCMGSLASRAVQRRPGFEPRQGGRHCSLPRAGKSLPTAITGSLPRPSWYTENLGSAHVPRRDGRHPLPRAVRGRGLRVPARPGARRPRHRHRRRRRFDHDIGGQSWTRYPPMHMDGFEHGDPQARRRRRRRPRASRAATSSTTTSRRA